ncbi:hypothetical protein [Pseudomonas muyukensis]|uniref:Uncharacterized protein n=1 Tax=Pseudomonas muyukensis TaxID=2842357 RepID=A0ABX8M9I9_9PSED|nr:hypothetical protein [Pseudomonas muyukensis]QXH35207.1 hypothetical protein KSS95_24265 [Pseudomonas muyukensis]
MAFDAEIQKTINAYVSAHVADEAWHTAYFDFIGDATLAQRLGEEFISTRYIYKILEGLEADDWMLRSQIRLQVMSYASIYEAVLHYLLFDFLGTEPRVVALTEFPTKKQISIPPASLALLEKYLEHDGKKIIPTYEAVGRTDDTKVRFDKKAECAAALGMIEPWLKDELIEFYEARNAIHIHAEIRKSLKYQLDLSKRAYLRMQPFKAQLSAWRSAYVV